MTFEEAVEEAIRTDHSLTAQRFLEGHFTADENEAIGYLAGRAATIYEVVTGNPAHSNDFKPVVRKALKKRASN